jgi:hypothetical protein
MPSLLNGTGITFSNGSQLNSSPAATLRLRPRQVVYSGGTGNGGVVTLSLNANYFEGNTPSFVMYSAAAQIGGQTDIRYFFMCSGAVEDFANLVMGSSSDDTDQNGTARGNAASTFVLPYNASQQFATFLYGGSLNISIIGYQV